MKGLFVAALSLLSTLSVATPTKFFPRSPRGYTKNLNHRRQVPDSVDVSTQIKALPASTVANNTIFAPPADYNDPQVLYARTVELENGDILATWENYR